MPRTKKKTARKRPQKKATKKTTKKTASPASKPIAAAPHAEPAPGRPVGSPTATDSAAVQPSRCTAPGCDSTERTKYRKLGEQRYRGIAPDGHPYNVIVRQRTSCKTCGRPRIDRTYHNAPSVAQPKQ